MFGELGVDAAAFGELAVGGIGGALHHYHELALALVVVGFDLGLQLRQGAVEYGFEQFGQLAGNDRRASSPKAKRRSASDSTMRCDDS